MFVKDLISLYCPSSVVGSRRNFRVESKLELNLFLEGLFLRKKNLGRHSRLVEFSLKLDLPENG